MEGHNSSILLERSIESKVFHQYLHNTYFIVQFFILPYVKVWYRRGSWVRISCLALSFGIIGNSNFLYATVIFRQYGFLELYSYHSGTLNQYQKP